MLNLPVLIDVLDLIDLLLNALAGHTVGLQLINLLVDQVRDGFVEILKEVLDHLWDDMVSLLLILPLIGQVCFRVTCRETEVMRRHKLTQTSTN